MVLGTDDIESKPGDTKGVCDNVHVVVYGQLSLEERRIFVVDVPTLEVQRVLGLAWRTQYNGSAPLRDDNIVT